MQSEGGMMNREQIDLDALEQKALAATRGPWTAVHAGSGCNGEFTVSEYFVINRDVCDDVAIASDIIDPITQEPSEANANYIAASAPNVIIELIRRLREAEKEIEELKHENHNLNVAMGATSYQDTDWYTEEERKESAEYREVINAGIERMKARAIELREQKRDAARYNWIKQQSCVQDAIDFECNANSETLADYDKAIDFAMSKESDNG
jgi:hypothetical protein